MVRDEEAYAVKLRGQILTHTSRSSPQEVFDEFAPLLKMGGKIIEVVLSEVDERPVFCPTAYLFSTPENEICVGAITFNGDVSQPKKIDPDHPLIGMVKKSINEERFTCDSILLLELDDDEASPKVGTVRMAIAFNVTDDGDTTTVSRLIQRNGIKPVIHRFLEQFNTR